jgi:hypothetical protein
MRAPDQPAHVHAARRRRRSEHLADLASEPGKPLVGVPAPVGEHQAVSGPHCLDGLEELQEVHGAMH